MNRKIYGLGSTEPFQQLHQLLDVIKLSLPCLRSFTLGLPTIDEVIHPRQYILESASLREINLLRIAAGFQFAAIECPQLQSIEMNIDRTFISNFKARVFSPNNAMALCLQTVGPVGDFANIRRVTDPNIFLALPMEYYGTYTAEDPISQEMLCVVRHLQLPAHCFFQHGDTMTRYK